LDKENVETAKVVAAVVVVEAAAAERVVVVGQPEETY
jgi:hypothetical protein